MNVGLSVNGFASTPVSDEALPGGGLHVALGGKGKYLGAEVGLDLAGYQFDPSSSQSDIGIVGITGDLKFQPSFGIVEPFVFVGLGGHILQDTIVDEALVGNSLRLGAGLDVHLDEFAVGARYLSSFYGFRESDAGVYPDQLSAHTESLGVQLKFYF